MEEEKDELAESLSDLFTHVSALVKGELQCLNSLDEDMKVGKLKRKIGVKGR
ncbi:hypothetical protein QJS10_CPB15g01096 [Acorus calamus]|uniref:Uncharacterized protein n=1 Tax=Acorus calamus TaxID=4465 RepID=A0AAV9DAA7_ACOCL|nr:hypothetical protein QJS10_CPB15g01096 [Acorus calamus]